VLVLGTSHFYGMALNSTAATIFCWSPLCLTVMTFVRVIKLSVCLLVCVFVRLLVS
jgi:hypothetical protein